MNNYLLPLLIGVSLLYPVQAEAKKFNLGETNLDLRLNIDTQVALVSANDAQTINTNVDWWG